MAFPIFGALFGLCLMIEIVHMIELDEYFDHGKNHVRACSLLPNYREAISYVLLDTSNDNKHHPVHFIGSNASCQTIFKRNE